MSLELFRRQKKAELGYGLCEKYQRQGYMDESLKVVIDFAFTTIKFTGIEAYTHKDNEASKKLLLKNGFILLPHKRDEDNENNQIYLLR